MNQDDIDAMICSVTSIADQIGVLAFSVTDTDAVPAKTQEGGRVGCLTEAIIYLANNTGRIADAISEIAEAIRESGSTIGP